MDIGVKYFETIRDLKDKLKKGDLHVLPHDGSCKDISFVCYICGNNINGRTRILEVPETIEGHVHVFRYPVDSLCYARMKGWEV